VFDDAGHVAQRTRERWRIRYFAKVAVEDVMAFVGDVWLPVFTLALNDLSA
jgi:hypothetical protein